MSHEENPNLLVNAMKQALKDHFEIKLTVNSAEILKGPHIEVELFWDGERIAYDQDDIRISIHGGM